MASIDMNKVINDLFDVCDIYKNFIFIDENFTVIQVYCNKYDFAHLTVL